MCPPELPSDLDDSEALVAGGASELALSTDSRESASTSGRRWLLVDARSFSSKRSPVLFLKPSGLRFLSIDFRSVVGFSNVVGSKERLRSANCCILLRLGAILASSSCSATVGAVVMIAGAVALRQYTHAQDSIRIRTRRIGGHTRDGRCIVVPRGMFLCLGGELGVRGMAEAHQTEALGVGCVFLYGRRRWGVVITIIMARRGPRSVGGRGAEAIFRGGYSTLVEVLLRPVEARVLVGAPVEEAGRVEGAPSLEVSFAAAGAEGAQRHGCRAD